MKNKKFKFCTKFLEKCPESFNFMTERTKIPSNFKLS